MNGVHRKVSAAAVGGAFATLTVFVLAQLGVDAGPEVAAALTTLAAFAAGYLKTA
jgi:hypothetical protein